VKFPRAAGGPEKKMAGWSRRRFENTSCVWKIGKIWYEISGDQNSWKVKKTKKVQKKNDCVRLTQNKLYSLLKKKNNNDKKYYIKTDTVEKLC